MTTIAIGSRLVHRAELHVPWVGRWVLRAWFDGPPPSGKVTVQWGSTALVGTVLPTKSGATVGEGVATIVGGYGWQLEPPATWLVDASAAPAQVAMQLAKTVGEELVLDASALVGARAAYARAAQPASLTMRELLASGALWWVELGGGTRAAADRPSPVLSSEIVLEYDPEARIARLDVLEPSQAPVGGVIGASAERFDALRIYAIEMEASDQGVLTTARLAPPTDASPSPHLGALLEGSVRGAPLRPHETWRQATVQSQDGQGRFSLRLEERDKELVDPLPVRGFCGVPGVTATVFAGTRTMLAFDRANPASPFAALWSPLGEVGHVPRRVAHEAAEEIRMVSQSGGSLHVGADTQRVAMAEPLISYLSALERYIHVIDQTVLAAASFLMIPPPFSVGQILQAIDDRITAAGYIPLAQTPSFSAVRALRLYAEGDVNKPGPPGGGG